MDREQRKFRPELTELKIKGRKEAWGQGNNVKNEWKFRNSRLVHERGGGLVVN